MAGQASHIVPVSNPLFIILRGVQIFLAVALLGILAYLGWAYSAVYGSFTSIYSGAIGVGLFTVRTSSTTTPATRANVASGLRDAYLWRVLPGHCNVCSSRL